MRYIITSGALGNGGGYSYALFQGEREWVSGSSTSTGKLRPIVTLFADVLINGGEGTKKSPYLLTK